MAFLNQAATEVAEVHQSYVFRTNTSKKLSSMKVRVVARRMRSETEAHKMLESVLGRKRTYKNARGVYRILCILYIYLPKVHVLPRAVIP